MISIDEALSQMARIVRKYGDKVWPDRIERLYERLYAYAERLDPKGTYTILD